MKAITKIIVPAIMMLLPNYEMYAQVGQLLKESKKPPQTNEIIIGNISDSRSGGYVYDEYEAYTRYFTTSDGTVWPYLDPGYKFVSKHDITITFSEEDLMGFLVNSAMIKYGGTHPNFYLRNFKSKREYIYNAGEKTYQNEYRYNYYSSATVVIMDPNVVAKENLSKAIDKALMDVREGSRIAIDQVKVPTEINKEEYKDEVVEILLDKGFKVVAKEYLEKLYEEQQAQQSGIYNDRTTVKDNNFSAVGYYLNVRLTETALRVQVINVSTGEYEGNVTIKLQQ